MIFLCHRLQLAGHRAVDHRIADDDPGPADERRIDAGGGLDLLAETSLQRALESGKLSLAQRKCAGDLRPRKTFGGVLEVCEKVANVREQSDSIGADQHPDEVAAVGVKPVGADGQKERFLVAGGKLGVVERRAHFPIARDRRRDPQHLRPDGQRVLLARELERRLGVGSGNGDRFSHGAV